MPTIKAFANQTTVDLALQGAGSVEGLFDFAQANGMGITDDIASGTDYIAPNVIDKRNAEVFQVYGKPASYIDADTARLGGISYMQIGNDFKVS